MKIPIIRIGNSKGIVISKTLLEKYEFENELELVMKQNHLELKPVREPRSGWEDQFRLMHEKGEDRLIIEDLLEDDLLEEW